MIYVPVSVLQHTEAKWITNKKFTKILAFAGWSEAAIMICKGQKNYRQTLISIFLGWSQSQLEAQMEKTLSSHKDDFSPSNFLSNDGSLLNSFEGV